MASKAKKKPTKAKPATPKTSTNSVNFELLKELSAFMKAEKLGSLRYEKNDFKCELKSLGSEISVSPRQVVPAVTATPAANLETKSDSAVTSSKNELISSPFVGTFYRTPSPGADPFVDTGKLVNPGATLCIIEAMKLMNEIEAEFKCRIVRVLVENGTPVEFGEPLFEVERVK